MGEFNGHWGAVGSKGFLDDERGLLGSFWPSWQISGVVVSELVDASLSGLDGKSNMVGCESSFIIYFVLWHVVCGYCLTSRRMDVATYRE